MARKVIEATNQTFDIIGAIVIAGLPKSENWRASMSYLTNGRSTL